MRGDHPICSCLQTVLESATRNTDEDTQQPGQLVLSAMWSTEFMVNTRCDRRIVETCIEVVLKVQCSLDEWIMSCLFCLKPHSSIRNGLMSCFVTHRRLRKKYKKTTPPHTASVHETHPEPRGRSNIVIPVL